MFARPVAPICPISHAPVAVVAMTAMTAMVMALGLWIRAEMRVLDEAESEDAQLIGLLDLF